jgi:hypothetical protein
MSASPFTDMLNPGEVVLAQIAGEGRATERGGVLERTWWQLALTRERLLVVRMRAVSNDRWEMVHRLAAFRGNLRFGHFPRTAADTARLSIDGCGERIVLVDVDRPPVLQQVQPFLAAWGGPVAGGESVARIEDDGMNDNAADGKKFLIAAVVIAVATVVCCGCLGLLGVLQQLLGVVFEIG